MNLKNFIKSVVFILLLAASFSFAQGVLRAKFLDGNGETFNHEHFYTLPENSIDVIFVGSSQIVYGINEIKLYEDYGISGYNMSGSNQPVMMGAAWIKEARRFNDTISTVVYDVSMLFEIEYEESYNKQLDYMQMSSNKIEYLKKYNDTLHDGDRSQLVQFFIPIIQYHDRWTELTMNDFDYSEANKKFFRGYKVDDTVYHQPITYEEFVIDNDTEPEGELVETQYKSFLEIYNYCKDNNLNLLLIKTPKTTWSLSKHNAVVEMAEDLGLEFLDFSTLELQQQIGFRYDQDMADRDHLNVRGAQKLTAYIGEYLKANYDLPDRRSAENDELFNVDDYHNALDIAIQRTVVDVDDIIEYAKDSKYECLVYSTVNDSDFLMETKQHIMEGLGAKADKDRIGNEAVFVRLSKGKVKKTFYGSDLEDIDGVLQKAGTFSDGVPYSMSTDRLKIGEDRMNNIVDGIYFMFYDAEKHEVVDKAIVYRTGRKVFIKHKLLSED